MNNIVMAAANTVISTKVTRSSRILVLVEIGAGRDPALALSDKGLLAILGRLPVVPAVRVAVIGDARPLARSRIPARRVELSLDDRSTFVKREPSRTVIECQAVQRHPHRVVVVQVQRRAAQVTQ